MKRLLKPCPEDRSCRFCDFDRLIPAYSDSPQEKRCERYTDRIDDAFERDAVLARFDLEADAEGGRPGYIKLEGWFRTAAQRNRSFSIVRRVAPGYRIVNLIRVRWRSSRDKIVFPQQTFDDCPRMSAQHSECDL